MISGHGNIESAVRAIKMGAFDFVEKPLSLEKTVLVVRNALRQRDLEAENRALRARVDRQHVMVGESFAMRQLREQVEMAAPTNGRVLIYGENGTGKELVARTVHQFEPPPERPVRRGQLRGDSGRADRIGAVRPHEGRVHRRGGRQARAGSSRPTRGTIFLDEIGDMSLKTQAKVLRVLQEQVMERVGGTQRIRVDVRVLAATNKELPAEIRGGRFREDLYFRLNVIPIFVPPLRDRQDDIPLLADHFMALMAAEYGRRPKRFAPEAAARLQHYAWPGNVRELRNVIERLMIMVPGDTITAQDLAFLGHDERPARPPSRSDRRCRWPKRASASSATTSCRRWRRSTATSRARRTCSASSEQSLQEDEGVRDRARRGNELLARARGSRRPQAHETISEIEERQSIAFRVPS